MLRFFRINDPYRLVIVLIAMILIRLVQGYFIQGISYFGLKWLLLGEWLNQGFDMYAETFDYTGPLAVLVFKGLDVLFGRAMFAHATLSTLVILYQAAVFNQILLRNKVYEENSYLPAFLYAILLTSVPDFMVASPQLLSLTFVLLALKSVLRRIDNQVTDELFINSGIYVGLATMIYLPSAVFFLVYLVALILFSTAILRRLLLYLFSFLLVFSLFAIFYYWQGHLALFLDSYIIQSLVMEKGYSLSIKELALALAGFVFIFLLTVIKTWGSARFTNFQRKVQQVVLLMLLGASATFFVSNEKSLHELVFVVPVITFFWTHYFILLKRRFFKAVMPAILIFGLIGYTTFLYQSKLGTLLAKNVTQYAPRTMVLGVNLEAYKEAKILTPCFDVHLSLQALAGLNYYGSAAQIFKLFLKADPDIIIDDAQFMSRINHRFPLMEARYRKTGSKVYEKTSN